MTIKSYGNVLQFNLLPSSLWRGFFPTTPCLNPLLSERWPRWHHWSLLFRVTFCYYKPLPPRRLDFQGLFFQLNFTRNCPRSHSYPGCEPPCFWLGRQPGVNPWQRNGLPFMVNFQPSISPCFQTAFFARGVHLSFGFEVLRV